VWNEDPGGTPELIGEARRGWSDHEDLHRMRAAIVMYPLIENAIGGARGRTVEAHQQAIGTLMARFARWPPPTRWPRGVRATPPSSW
jgi:acetyl-CoA C-acetyltransferase